MSRGKKTERKEMEWKKDVTETEWNCDGVRMQMLAPSDDCPTIVECKLFLTGTVLHTSKLKMFLNILRD